MSVSWYNYLSNNPRDVVAPGGVTKPVRRLDVSSLARFPVCGIYKITNLVNGMPYIGQSRNIRLRWNSHKKGRERDHNYYIHNAIAKYGIDSFSFEILEECSIDQLNELECKYIVAFNSLNPNGYNLDLGGGAGKEVSQETRQKQSASHLGEKNHNYGKPKSDSTKLKMSLAQIVSINQYSMGGKYIRTFSSAEEAMVKLGTGSKSHIFSCCNGGRRTAFKFQWRYAKYGTDDITPTLNNLSDKRAMAISIPVSQFTKEGVYVNTFQSGKLASRVIGRAAANITACCKGIRPTSGGFIWRYAK